MDETWIKELNMRNIEEDEDDDSTQWEITVVLDVVAHGKLSKAEQSKFDIGDISVWIGDEEEICEHFGIEDSSESGEIYIRRFKDLTKEEEKKWFNLSQNVLVLW